MESGEAINLNSITHWHPGRGRLNRLCRLLWRKMVSLLLLASNENEDEAAAASSSPVPDQGNSDEDIGPGHSSTVRSIVHGAQEQVAPLQPSHVPVFLVLGPPTTLNWGLDISSVHQHNFQPIRLFRFPMEYTDPHFECHQVVVNIPFDVRAMMSYQTQKPLSVLLGKTFLGLTYQAVVAFLVFHFQGTSTSLISNKEPPTLLLHIAEVAVVLGFTACLIGLLLRQAYPTASGVIEKGGSFSAALGFFVMMAMFLTSISMWIGWLCGAASLVAFVLAFKKVKTE